MKKLYRSRQDKKLFGLCGGIAQMLNVDATLLRILLIVITVFTSGAMILIYILAGLVVPKEPPLYNDFGQGGYGYGGGYNGGYGSGYKPNQGFGGPYTGQTPPQPGPGGNFANWSTQPQGQSASNLDAVMDDLEKKALRREIEELRAKLAKYEKGEL
ncbi:phage shock protein PspC (stress-responsive transcriptional regulator) [Paenibacillus phyllosphaerae]|uniref:Phage shock protein PspC (Stress-responsive transcriptional regulator) n=1 Tax=Paenibacillus phyllosphaerae TaxID=274593 RepID=A0A7W5FRV7_9BACL|nr:PspC domain-containing protein [Paenibacillus phyllosphaerae]MBB3114702.1 phage shock protein PspC (stress-responsive transcriptional regulator) [Paenibacillus phyllosphaerae]